MTTLYNAFFLAVLKLTYYKILEVPWGEIGSAVTREGSIKLYRKRRRKLSTALIFIPHNPCFEHLPTLEKPDDAVALDIANRSAMAQSVTAFCRGASPATEGLV